MSACDRRSYYPAPVGLLKIRASDGDTQWDCRPTGASASTIALLKAGNRVYATALQASLATNLIDEDGDGILSDITLTDPVGTLISVLGGSAPTIADLNDDYLYLAGQATSGSNSVVHKFNVATGALVGSATIGVSNVSNMRFRALAGETEEFDLVGNSRIRRYNDLSGAAVLQSAATTLFQSGDRAYRLISDGTFYYHSISGGMLRINISDLTTAQTRAGIGTTFTDGEVREGRLFLHSNAFGSAGRIGVLSAANLLTLWINLTYYTRTTGIDGCSDFAVVIGIRSGTNTATATSWVVHRRNVDSSEVWSRTLTSTAPGTTVHRLPRVVLSQDETKVYCFGPFVIGGLSMGIVCLDATNGDILWAVACPAGVSLIDDGDYVYLGTIAGTAPEYR